MVGKGKFERDVLRRVRKIQSSARDVVQERRMQDAQFGKKPQKLVVPAHADLANMFDPSTWAMAFPDLFPYGDGVPFLIREAPSNFWKRCSTCCVEKNWSTVCLEMLPCTLDWIVRDGLLM